MTETQPPAATGALDWQLSRLHQLPPLDLLRIMRARQQVFVVEQNCPYLDADRADESSWHLVAWRPDRILCAYARIVDPGINYPEASIGRVMTAQAVRGSGLGRELLARAIEHATSLHPAVALKISAQSHLQAFYASVGFVAIGNIYLEDGIAHIAMIRAVDQPPPPDSAGLRSDQVPPIR